MVTWKHFLGSSLCGLLKPIRLALSLVTSTTLISHSSFAQGTDPFRVNDLGFVAQYSLLNSGKTFPFGTALPGADIRAPWAWSLAPQGFEGDCRNVAVAVVDSGIDWSHPDLIHQMAVNPGETGIDPQGVDRRINGIDDDNNGYIDDWRGWNFRQNTNQVLDNQYHGTHVAGIIGAEANNQIGVSGVCQKAKIYSIKLSDQSGTSSIFDAIDATLYLGDLRDAHGELLFPVSNHSYGGPGLFLSNLGPSWEAAIAHYVNAGSKGGIFAAAAGNFGYDIDDRTGCNPLAPYNCWGFYPAGFSNPRIVVTASSDYQDQLSSFSNWGPISVDLSAPGDEILSTTPYVPTHYMNQHHIRRAWAFVSGTSMASPLVAGSLAYIWSLHPHLDADAVIAKLLRGSDPNRSSSNLTRSGGRLNLYRSAQ